MPLTPKNRKEEWLQGLVDHETTLTPKNRPEEWMLGLVEGSTTLTPKNRCEEWLKEIIDASGGGGGSYEIETGTWTPSEDVAIPTIPFENEHTTLPVFVAISDATENDQTLYTSYFWSIVVPYLYTNAVFPGNDSNNTYAVVAVVVRKNNMSGVTGSRYLLTGMENETTWFNVKDYISTNGFTPYTDPTNGVPVATTPLWRTNLTYKWIAAWAPTV